MLEQGLIALSKATPPPRTDAMSVLDTAIRRCFDGDVPSSAVASLIDMIGRCPSVISPSAVKLLVVELTSHKRITDLEVEGIVEVMEEGTGRCSSRNRHCTESI